MASSVASRRKSIKAARAPPPLAAITGSNKAAQRRLSSSAARSGNADVPAAASKAQPRPSQTQVAVAQPNNKPDVFQFLQQGDSSSSTPSDTDSEDQEHDEDEDEDEEDDDDDDDDDEEDEKKPTNKPRSPTSSRIVHRSDLPSPVSSSFRASSPEQTFSVASRDSISTDPEPTTPPEGSPATAYLRLAHKHITQSRGQRRRVSSREDHQQSDYSAPEDYYIPSRAQSRRLSSPHEGAGTLVPTNKNKSPAKKNTRRATISGYASLASKLDSSDKDTTTNNNKLAPVYRRFENVNHRILLYLQDEISQMEEELQLMDEYDATHRASIAEEDGSHPEPASRRMDVEAARHFSGFHARRTELLERLMYKTNQYNEALYTYNKMRHALPKASPKDVQAYRTWMGENTPIAKNETAFLDHELDLVSLNAVAVGAHGGDNSILYFIIGVMSAALLLPLLAY